MTFQSMIEITQSNIFLLVDFQNKASSKSVHKYI